MSNELPNQEVPTQEVPKMQEIQIQVKSAKLNLQDERNIQIQFSILSNDNQIKEQLTIDDSHNQQLYSLKYEPDDQMLQISLLINGKQTGFSDQIIQNLFNNEINEIKIIHESIVVGVLGIQLYNPQNQKKESQRLQEFLNETGLEKIFTIIFAEILTQKININEVYKYSANRLREIGKKIQSENQ